MLGMVRGFRMVLGRKNTKRRLVQLLQGDPPSPTRALGLGRAGDQHSPVRAAREAGSAPGMCTGRGGGVLEKMLFPSIHPNTIPEFIKPGMENTKEQNPGVVCTVTEHVQVLRHIWKTL